MLSEPVRVDGLDGEPAEIGHGGADRLGGGTGLDVAGELDVDRPEVRHNVGCGGVGHRVNLSGLSIGHAALLQITFGARQLIGPKVGLVAGYGTNGTPTAVDQYFM